MNPLRGILFLPFAAVLALGPSGHQHKTASLPNQPEAFVQSLYREVLAHHPIGIITYKERKIFAPYLSEMLIRRLDTTRACADDYFRHNRDPNVKPPFAWLETGTFSGGDDESALKAFHVEKIKSERNGSISVYVRLSWDNSPSYKPWFTHVAAIIVQENGHLVVDDVIYLGEESRPETSRLSENLSMGCDGRHWVGYGKR